MGHDLAFAVGVAQGHATLGRIGYEGRFDYTAIGGVVNLAARLCSEAAGGQILVDRRARAGMGDGFAVEPVAPLVLKGFDKPVPAFVLTGSAP
jgi:class 3 adenylate cyclase